MKYSLIPLLSLTFLIASCSNNSTEETAMSETIEFQNPAHELVYKMTEKVGNYQKLKDLKDVSYTYIYQTPDGKTDIAAEKYIFDGEYSYADYIKHDRTLPELSGKVEQGFDGETFWVRHNGVITDDQAAIDRAVFSRKTNFYWFTMMQKLMDPGLNYEMIGEDKVGDKTYDVVKVSFNSPTDEPTDIYQLFINRETGIVDQFLFTVVAFGVVDPMLMQMEYEDVQGVLIPTKRQYKKSNWDAEVNEDPWIYVNWTDIKFDNNLDKSIFEQKDIDVSLLSLLTAKKDASALRSDEHKKAVYAAGIEAVANSGVLTSAMQVGDVAPNFTLKNALGENVALYDELKKGKVVLTWYRGGWCPYCNLTLSALQKELPNFKTNGANLIALTPELPDSSLNTSEKNKLEFEILSDVGNKIANKFGIVFDLTPDVAAMYNASFDMNAYNGDKSNQLPLAATYVIAEDGKILYAFLDADYRNRAEPSEITAFLKEKK